MLSGSCSSGHEARWRLPRERAAGSRPRALGLGGAAAPWLRGAASGGGRRGWPGRGSGDGPHGGGAQGPVRRHKELRRQGVERLRAPMEEKERRALYAAIESFVGKGWNGSGLYPDPCGWSPIQVRPCLPACVPALSLSHVSMLLCCLISWPAYVHLHHVLQIHERSFSVCLFFGFARARHMPFLGAPLL